MKTLFISLGSSAPAWYRCGLPANQLDIDWIGLWKPNDGLLAGNIEEFDFDDYDLFIVQQPRDIEWQRWIKSMQKKGKTVLFEVDDFLHGVHRIEGHSRRKEFNKKNIKKYVECMKLCDGMICSTEFLAEQYKKYNSNQYVCKVGIDTERYKVEFPWREKTVIGWAGGTGHHLAVGPWLEAISNLMYAYEEVSFITVGTPYADTLSERHPGRTLSVPWTTIENLPYCLTHFDIYIAPLHDSKYFRSKSDLRWLEASAVGIPGVLAPEIYLEVEDGETGLLATSPKKAKEQLEILILDKTYREKIGKQAQEYVSEKRDIKQMGSQWTEILKN